VVVWLVSSRTVLASVAVSLAGLLLHRKVLSRSSVAVLGIHVQLLMEKGQLLVELASRLREFLEPHPPLGVGGAVARSRLWSELLDAEATQTLHSRMGSCRHVVRAL
jgi:hypothetical protein